MVSPTARQPEPMYILEMMRRLGVEPGAGVVARLSLSYATAFHRCQACTARQACREWLGHMPAAVTLAPSFCPNADILFELQVDQGGLAHPAVASAA